MDGSPPDGRCTGTCDRCGTAIMRVFCFARPNDLTNLMHVGIDCAGRMGVPLAELRSARGFFVRRQREAEAAMRYASQAERRAAEEAARAAREAERAENLRENAAFVEVLTNLRNHPSATQWEKDQIELMIGATANQGIEWLDEPENTDSLDGLMKRDGMGDARMRNNEKLRKKLDNVGTRLGLCDTSKGVTDKVVTGEFYAYRDCIVMVGVYGRTFRNFLTDGKGNAFTYKGSSFGTEQGDKVVGTFSNGDTETYEGLTSTILTRPRKVVVDRVCNRPQSS